MPKWIFVLAAFVLPAAGWAQSPCDSPLHWGKCRDDQTGQPGQESRPNERGTQTNPIVVDIIPSPDAKAKAAQAAHDEHEKEIREWHLVKGTYAIAFLTGLLFLGTGFLAVFTLRLWRTTKKGADEALAASTKATETLSNIERAYLTGGGDIVRRAGGKRIFRVDVANYGKTAAFLSHYDVQFTEWKEVEGVKKAAWPVFMRTRFDDRIPPDNKTRHIDYITVPDGTEVIFGAFWYRDWRKNLRTFRFILRVNENHRTRPDVTDVHPDYFYWD
jgi:hypothetical protein